MVEILRGWLLGLVAAALILTVLRSLVPKGSIRPVARVTAGLVLLLVLLRPLAGLGGGSLRVRYDELEREITARIEDYQTLHENELESIIADSTAAYISEQAAHLGLTCRAEVRCEVRDGTPQPASAAMDISYDARLAAAIADDLGIPAEKQSWQGGEAP